MTQEDKDLLLKDLSSRLPYRVIVRHADPLVDNDGNETGEFWYKMGYLCDITTLDDMTTTIIESEGSDEEGYEHICDLERSLPYLRPMLSMTEEEKKEYAKIVVKSQDCSYENNESATTIVNDWYLYKGFDVRGLIPKGLALDCTNLNIY